MRGAFFVSKINVQYNPTYNKGYEYRATACRKAA